MANRLAAETSPYLQQHAANPVDWYPWGPQALARAEREDRPILLSIGYSACHWCHVMAHESFEDADVAAVMNRHFVNVKVDREERPDLDLIYQAAHQMLAQRGGGWPLTMFLAPDGTPFFGGTYFPKTPRHGLPGFADLLARVAQAWRERRDDIRAQGEELRRALARIEPAAEAAAANFDFAPIADAIAHLEANFDARHGGFGRAPKFPHCTDLELCLRHRPQIALKTLDGMIAGGIHDQLGGGFCRYSVDESWTIPHFEKMLYDNGALLAVLAQAFQATGEARYRRAAADTCAWLLREMQSPEGGFYSSIDADSEGVEGRYYVWDRDEVRARLTPQEYAAAAPAWGLDRNANFEGRHWHLFRAQSGDAGPLLESARRKLLAAREARVRPGRDEKILTSWNALVIRGLAMYGRAAGEDVAPARRALAFLRRHLWRDGRLLATYKDGRAQLNAYLDDYAFLIDALIELMQAEFDPADLAFARELADVLLEEFEDADAGGFYFTGRSHEALIHRPKPGHDNATPSGNGVAALALNRLAAITGDARYADAAARTVALFLSVMRRQPAGFGVLMQALAEQLQPPATLILRGEAAALRPWREALGRDFLPATMVMAIPDGTGGLPAILDKPARAGAVNAWLCRGVTCLTPITDLDEARAGCKNPVFR